MANEASNGNYNSQIFNNVTEIDTFFQKFGSSGYADWFNSKPAQTTPWRINENDKPKKYIINEQNWKIVWSNLQLIFGRPSINLVEFLCATSIMTNETGGKYIPLSEGSNKSTSTIPGIAYEFNAGSKRSYNTLKGNKTAYECFHDPVYIAAHGTKPLASILRNTTDNRWSGTNFPVGFSGLSVADETSDSGKANGFLIEADFFKFRGRGFIQTTSRPNYKDLVKFVLNYTGNDGPVLSVKKEWSKYNGDSDSILTASTNAQWDLLFNQKNFIIANYAVYSHNQASGNHYFPINSNQSTVNLQTSIINVGAKIAGGGAGTKYAKLFLQRVQIQLDIINGTNTLITNELPPLASKNPIPQTEGGRLERTGQDPNTQVNTTGQISTLTNLFQPTAKPEPISFDTNG